MKGIKTKIILPPFKAWFTFVEKIAVEWAKFTLSADSLVAYTATDETKRKAMAASYLKKGNYPRPHDIWSDPLYQVPKAAFIVHVSDKAVDGAVAYVSDDLKLWRKAPE